MKKYLSFFRLRFVMGLQYRSAALAGLVTQFFWGFMSIMIFRAFYKADALAFPMSLSATASYIWLQQAFLALFAAWMMENEIFDSIVNGNIVYELCRPVNVYNMWFSRSIANRLSRALMRCFPIMVIAVVIPQPYGLSLPASFEHFIIFIITLILGLAVTVSFCMLVYMLTFFTVSAEGIRMLFVSSVEFFAGAVIPIPFFPENVQKILEILPFASMQNVALRIYSGSMDKNQMIEAISWQILWLIIITVLGKLLYKIAEKRICIQGG